MTRADENDQRTSTSNDDIPRTSPDPPLPPISPDEPAQRLDKPPSVKLEGESGNLASIEVGLTADKAHVLGASTDAEDPRNKPKKPWNTSERAREHWKRRTREYSPGRPREVPDKPGGETAAPGSVHDVQECPKNVRNECTDATNSPEPSEPPRDPRSDQEARRPVEGELGSRKAVEGAGYDGIHHSTHRNECIIETNALHRGMGPGGHLGEGVKSRGIADDWDRQRVIRGGKYNAEHTRTEENERVVETNVLRQVGGPGGHSCERVRAGDAEGDQQRRSERKHVEIDGR